jgi:hypothetical protein
MSHHFKQDYSARAFDLETETSAACDEVVLIMEEVRG